jgi:hypothetical protein
MGMAETENGTVRTLIGVPSYKGPHKDAFARHNEFHHYLGRLQERSLWHDALKRSQTPGPSDLRPLDLYDKTGAAEIRPDDPVFEFLSYPITGISLPGLARDRCIEAALEAKADYLLLYDDDMIFDNSLFLKLWRHRKPFMGALAFTSREPIAPVLYQFRRTWDFAARRETVESVIVFDYPRDQLFQLDAIGSGVLLISTDVFRKLERPWFHGSIGSGEDVHLCFKAWQKGIPIYCDTSCKTRHARNDTHWMDEEYYLQARGRAEEFYQGKIASAK